MTTWFTSDTHFGHKNILEYCNRPFRDVTHMNNAIVGMWNELVAPDDTVWHLGDVALGKLDESLEAVSRLNGNIFLVPGNHDRVWAHWYHKSIEKRQRFDAMYADAGLKVVHEIVEWELEDNPFLMCHLPYDGDSQEDERYVELRPENIGLPLVHGHIHTKDTVRGLNQFHVGMDAHGYKPVHEDVIKEWLSGLN